MTVIAWDGATLAADKRCVFGSEKHTITKIKRVNGCLIGSSGPSDGGAEIMDWFAKGADPDKFKERVDWADLLVILPSGEINLYQRTPIPISMPNQKFATGSGSEYASAAMFLGMSAYDAVGVACALDPNCGNGIDVLSLCSNESHS